MVNKSNGFWGKPTATIDWCEQNYEVTHYIAEFWNTISNLIMILMPLYGVYWSLMQRSRHRLQEKLNKTDIKAHYFDIPDTVISCHLGLLCVGIGSWLFHMTLLYTMQLFDEIPMIWASGVLIYGLFDLLYNIMPQLSRYKNIKMHVKLANLVYNIIITYVYIVHLTNPIFHEIAYGVQVTCIVVFSVAILQKLNLSKRLYLLSFFYYAFGFILWNIDNNLCKYLKNYRQFIDSYIDLSSDSFKSTCVNWFLIFLKSFSEFHSLWHLFTGYGTYLLILFLMDAHYENYNKSLMNNKGSIKKNEKYKHNHPINEWFFRLFYTVNRKYDSTKHNMIKNT